MKPRQLDKQFKDALYKHEVTPPAEIWAGVQSGLGERSPALGTGFSWKTLMLVVAVVLVAGVVAWQLLGDSAKQAGEPSGPDQLNFAAVSDINEASNETSLSEGNIETSSVEMYRGADAKESNTTSEVAPSAVMTTPAATGSIVNDNTTASASQDRTNTKSASTSLAFTGTKTNTVEEEQPTPIPASTGSEAPLVPVSLAPLRSNNQFGGVDYRGQNGLSNFMVTDCYDFGSKRKGNITLDVYTGPSVAIKSMKSRAEDVSSYINMRDTTESGQLSWNAGIRLGYEHQSGFTLRVGGHYSLVNEVFKTQTRTTQAEVIYDNQGMPIDTIWRDGTRTKQTQNRYHALDVPLLVGYQIQNGDWYFGVQAGPTFNLMFNAKGDMLNPLGQVSSFSDESDMNYSPVFKDRVGVSVYGSVYAAKRIGTSLYAFIEPSVLHRTGSITLDNYPIDQRQTLVNLSIGLRYVLGNN